ncbi:MAG TPA: MBL fold metallo-hydrolase [Bryobacteraceae bacterium]|jgi:glyoxylase-like metal-dependent hydrolase (beta-lactamase superfamily II)|nr:MBL fold metallo-hydrolase [Bryobacteraceae bacterium]
MTHHARDQIAGVTTLTLPMPWELESVNVHLIELDEGFLLIDSGIATQECFDALQSSLDQRGVGWRDIRLLCLTHLHPDHIGLSWKILELSGARLAMHRDEVKYLAEVARESRPPFFEDALLRAGVPEPLRKRMDHALRDIRRHFREHSPDWVLEGGEKIPIRGGALEVLWTPGHSPGHICFYSAEHRYLISGDHLLQFITPNIGWHPNADMLASYLDSLERLERFDVDLVVPSHGRAFRGHRERIRQTTDHHQFRCGEILRHVAGGPRTADDLVKLLWPRGLAPFHHHFAVFEVLAHLEYLERRGRIASEPRDGGALWWQPVQTDPNVFSG